MSLEKYTTSWVGIDGGREGLWKEPLWTEVLKIIAVHTNEMVYDSNSAIYQALENKFPHEAWRCYTAEGHFRPLFRDYPNSWTRTGVISLSNQRFNITPLGLDILSGKVTKTDVLVEMFQIHEEFTGESLKLERPFAIIASAFLETNRPLKTEEVYWAVMKNYRPTVDNLSDVIKKKLPLIAKKSGATPYRRLRNMLSLMRSANMIESTRRGTSTIWTTLDRCLLTKISKGV